MVATVIQNPLPTFYGTNGIPLTGGYVYFGEPNMDPRTNPVSVFYDDDLTIPAVQPLRTTAGYLYRNGAPTNVWTAGNYSVLVLDANRRQVYYYPEWAGASSATMSFLQAGTGAVARTAQDKMREFVSIKDFGAVGNGVTDDTAAILAACNYAISAGKSVLVPAGTYICTYNVLLFTFSGAANSCFSLCGQGSASILKMANGAMTANGRRFLDFRPTGVTMDVIEVCDLVLDNNARGSPPPAAPSDYEQCHTLRMAAASGATVKLLRYHNVVIKDPVADGINNQGQGLVENMVISNCAEIDRTRTRSSIQFSVFPECTTITGFVGPVIEAEASSDASTYPKQIAMSNCQIQKLDFGGNSVNDVTVWASNVIVEKLQGQPVVTGSTYNTAYFAYCRVLATNCRFPLRVTDGRLNSLRPGSRFQNCRFLMAYDTATGAVRSMDIRPLSASTSVEFIGCDLLIDYVGTLPFAATGAMVAPAEAVPVGAAYDVEFAFRDCRFDPRAQQSVSCFRNGTWTLENNIYGGTQAAIFIAPNATFEVQAMIKGGDFSQVTGTGFRGSWGGGPIDQATTICLITLAGAMTGTAAGTVSDNSGVISNTGNWWLNTREVSSSALTTGGILGDTLRIIAPVSGKPDTYRCTASGSSGAVWRVVGQAGVNRGLTAARPTALTTSDVGTEYLDNTLAAAGKPIWWNGTAWVDATGTAV